MCCRMKKKMKPKKMDNVPQKRMLAWWKALVFEEHMYSYLKAKHIISHPKCKPIEPFLTEMLPSFLQEKK